MTPEKKVTIITGVFIALVVVVGGGAIYWFHFEELAALKAQRDKAKKEYDVMVGKQMKLQELRQKEKELPQREEKLGRSVPTLPSGTWDPHRQHFYVLRKKCGVSLKRDVEQQIVKKPGQAAGGPGKAEESAFELTIEGGFNNIGRFIHMLEHGDPIMIVDGFGIKGRRSPTGVALKELRIKVKSYGFPPAVPPPAPASAPRP